VTLVRLLHSKILPQGVIGPRVGVTARGGEALVAERLLHEVSRRAAVEGVRGVGEPKPMRRDALGGAGAPGGFFDNAPEL